MITVNMKRHGTTVRLEFSGTVQQLLDELELDAEATVVIRDERLLTVTDLVADGETIVILPPAFGG
jgi:sulfur carrier protein ThiS